MDSAPMGDLSSPLLATSAEAQEVHITDFLTDDGQQMYNLSLSVGDKRWSVTKSYEDFLTLDQQLTAEGGPQLKLRRAGTGTLPNVLEMEKQRRLSLQKFVGEALKESGEDGEAGKLRHVLSEFLSAGTSSSRRSRNSEAGRGSTGSAATLVDTLLQQTEEQQPDKEESGLTARAVAWATQQMHRLAEKFRNEASYYHSDGVNNVAISSDLCLIVVASEDTTCSVWSRKGGRWHCQQVLRGHTQGVCGVRISGDDSLIATSSADHTCRIWCEDENDLWYCKHTLEGHEGTLYYLAFAPDASLLATVSEDTTCRLWARGSDDQWICQQVLEGHTDAVYGVAIAEDMSFLATASNDHTCRVWARDGACRQVLEGHSEGLCSVTISPDGQIIATTADDLTCCLWGLEGGVWTCQHNLGHPSSVIDAAFSSSGSLLATGSADGTCRLWAKADGHWRCRQVLAGHTMPIYCVAVVPSPSQEGELMIGTGSEDQTTILWRYDGKHAYKATHIRPATDFEILMPAATLLCMFMQYANFAFSTHFHWNVHAVALVKAPLSITVMDVHLPISAWTEFLVKTLGSLLAIGSFVVCALADRGSFAVRVLSTMAATPIVKHLVEVFACTDGQLDVDPDVECFEGIHAVLAWSVITFGMVYLLLLLPFTAAQGDLSIMPRHVWLKPKEWVRRKADKTTGLELGFLNPSRSGAVPAAYTTLFVSLALPSIATLLRLYPLAHVGLSAAVATLPRVVTHCWPPFENRRVNVFMSAGYGLCIVGFLGACVAVLVDDPSSLRPPLTLLVGWIVVMGRAACG